jgi:hypothetical protein
MKHLRGFNESKWSKSRPRFSNLSKWIEDLQDFCDTNLAYLLDQGLIVKLSPQSQYVMITLVMDQDHGFDYFKWEHFKDSIIPWLTRLNQTYDISNKVNYYRLGGNSGTTFPTLGMTTNLKDILNDNFRPTSFLYELEIIIYI